MIAADWTGEIRVWDIKDGRRLANLAVNPAPIAARIESARRALPALQAEVDSLSKQIAPFQNAVAPANRGLGEVTGQSRRGRTTRRTANGFGESERASTQSQASRG